MITVRNAKDEDLPAILEIYNDVILNTTAVYDYIPHSLERRREWFNDKKTEGYPVFVAQEDEVLLGFSSIGPFRKWEAYKFSVENSVYVSNEHRGKGVGKLLLQPLIDAARSLQLHTIVAGIDATNEASIALDKKFGFEEVAHFKEVGYKFGRWLDLKFLQLIL